MRRRPTPGAPAVIVAAVSLMAWGAVLFYGHEPVLRTGGHYLVSGTESFAVFSAVPGQLLAALLMWVALRSRRGAPPPQLVVALVALGHLAGVVMSGLFAKGMLLYAPLLWVTPSAGMALILVGPAVALGVYFRRAHTPTLATLLAAGCLSVAVGTFAWSVLGRLVGVGPSAF